MLGQRAERCAREQPRNKGVFQGPAGRRLGLSVFGEHAATRGVAARACAESAVPLVC
jgi:hypothetical protein